MISEEQKQETEKLQLLVAAFSAKQEDQYEVFRRATFQKGTVRLIDHTPIDTIIIIIIIHITNIFLETISLIFNCLVYRRLMQTVCGISMSQNVVIAMSGMAKVLVGELMELGCQARDSRGETGPLQPKHIREATRKMRQSKKLPNSRPKSSVSYS